MACRGEDTVAAMDFELNDAVAVLERTPGAFRALLAGLPDAWTAPNEGPETFSARDNLGHVIHGQRADWRCQASTRRSVRSRCDNCWPRGWLTIWDTWRRPRASWPSSTATPSDRGAPTCRSSTADRGGRGPAIG